MNDSEHREVGAFAQRYLPAGAFFLKLSVLRCPAAAVRLSLDLIERAPNSSGDRRQHDHARVAPIGAFAMAFTIGKYGIASCARFLQSLRHL